jgi:hypothetical protein
VVSFFLASPPITFRFFPFVLHALPTSYSSESVRVSHISTDSHSVCLAWCRAPCGAHDQLFVHDCKVTVLSTWGRPLWREDASVICQS